MKTKTREKLESEPASIGQLRALREAGITVEPRSMLAAQNLLSQHYRSRSKRGKRGRQANKQRRARRKGAGTK
jgi:hypothetical protein